MNYCYTRMCPKCKDPKELMDFGKDMNRPTGIQSPCKECGRKANTNSYKKHREKRLKYKSNRHVLRYGITQQNYMDMFEQQNGCCNICGKHQTTLKYKLCVDHCHKTNKIRGLICMACNKALGLMLDDTQILQSAINYLTCRVG